MNIPNASIIIIVWKVSIDITSFQREPMTLRLSLHLCSIIPKNWKFQFFFCAGLLDSATIKLIHPVPIHQNVGKK